MTSIFRGLSAFPITPTDPAGRVDVAALTALVKRLRVSGVSSVGLLGSTGGYAYLTRSERQRAVVAARDAITDDRALIVSVGALRTDDAIALAQDAAEAGADGLLLAPMSYTPLTGDEVFAHFAAVSAATSLPLCIYNNPGTTHFNFDAALLERVAALPTVAAVKMPLPAKSDAAAEMADLRPRLPPDFVIGYSGDWGCGVALQQGADAWFSVLGGILPAEAVTLLNAARDSDGTEFAQAQARLAPLWEMFQAFGSIRVVYAIAQALGLTSAVPPLPIKSLDDAAKTRVAAILSALGADN